MLDPVVAPKPGETPPPADPPKVDPPADPPKAADPPKVDPPAPAGPRELTGEDDEPKPGERITLTTEAMAKRMQRATKAQLRAEFGTDDPKVLKDKLDRLTTLEAEAEERRKAQLTKEQQETEARQAAERERDEARRELAEERENANAQQGETEIRESLKDLIKPKFWKHIRADLAEHLVEEFGEKLESLTTAESEAAVKAWAEKYLKDNPEYAAKKDEPPPPAKKDEPAPIVVPLSNGVANRGRKPAPALTKFEGKTLKPGLPNSMTAKEVAEWKRATGNNY